MNVMGDAGLVVQNGEIVVVGNCFFRILRRARSFINGTSSTESDARKSDLRRSLVEGRKKGGGLTSVLI